MSRNLQSRRKGYVGGEQGYIMLTLLLIIALMAIMAMATAPTLKFSLQRDREEEMIHRGTQYSNAIRRFYKKFGRYPTKIEDLESSNNLRFLRKRYKDPMNCKAGKCADFKLLYFSDVQTSLSGFGGGVIPGATPAGSAGLGQGNTGGFGQSSPGSSFGQSSSFGGNSNFGGNSSSLFGGQNQQSSGQTSTGNQPGTDSSQPGSQNGSQPGSGNGSNDSAPGNTTSASSGIGSGQVIGGPIVGVASATKDTDNTIREFNHKKKYKDWMFIYDPMQDQGRLITTPYQPQTQGIGGAPNLNGQSGQNGNGASPNSSSFGSSSGFGSSGFGSSSFGSSSGSGSSSQPSAPPPQQQQ